MKQVEPKETDQWTKVEFTSYGAPVAASFIVIDVEAMLSYAPRVSDVTADACIPRTRTYWTSQRYT